MKARRVLQLIVAWLSAIFTPILAGLAILTFVPFLPNYIFTTTASNEFIVGILDGIKEVCNLIPISFVNPRPYLFACVVFILPTFMLWISSHILFSANRGKQCKYNFACIFALIAIVLCCGVVGGFSKVLFDSNMMIAIYCVAGVAFVFILFTLLALLVKEKAKCVCTLCECSECPANVDYVACTDCAACDVCDLCNTCTTRECESDDCNCGECTSEECSCCEGEGETDTAATQVEEQTTEESVSEVVEEAVTEAPAEQVAVEEIVTAEAVAEETAPEEVVVQPEEPVAQPAPVVEPAPQPAPTVAPAQQSSAVSQIVNNTYSAPSPTLTTANLKKLEVLRNLYISGAITKDEYTALVKEYLK